MQPRTSRILGQVGGADDLLVPLGVIVGASGLDGGFLCLLAQGGQFYRRYPLPVTRYPLPVTRYPLPVTRYPLAVSRQPSAVSRQPSAVSRQPSDNG